MLSVHKDIECSFFVGFVGGGSLFEAESHYLAHAILKLSVLMPQPL
jgi:hypothetical protein